MKDIDAKLEVIGIKRLTDKKGKHTFEYFFQLTSSGSILDFTGKLELEANVLEIGATLELKGLVVPNLQPKIDDYINNLNNEDLTFPNIEENKKD